MAPMPTGIRPLQEPPLIREGRKHDTRSPRSPQPQRGRGAAGGPLGWGHRGGDAKHRGRRVRLRNAGLGSHEGLCVHNTGVLSQS